MMQFLYRLSDQIRNVIILAIFFFVNAKFQTVVHVSPCDRLVILHVANTSHETLED